MVYDFNIHELNLRPFTDLKILDEISFLKCVFFAFLNNKYIYIRGKIITISKKGRFYRWALHYFFNFILFGNVL
jgi:hypothetical protein